MMNKKLPVGHKALKTYAVSGAGGYLAMMCTYWGAQFIPSGWMGDYGDIKYEGASKEDPYLGDSCIKIIYNGKKAQGSGWAGIFWQNPANNWGKRKGGYNLSGAQKLTFWARGEEGGEQIQEFTIGGITGDYPDSDTAVIGPVILSADWRQYTIDLRGKDLSYISGGFAWTTSEEVNPQNCTFYLDEIRFE